MNNHAIRITALILLFVVLCFPGIASATTASVDNMTLTVYYTESGGGGGSPVPALSFTSGGIALAGYVWSRRRTKPVLHSSPS